RVSLSLDRPLLPGPARRVYLVHVIGPQPLEVPPQPMSWSEYQAWLARLRAAGYQLTTHGQDVIPGPRER
ncbi:MAG: hypothetical protein NZO58_06085, partial [Gemmataceae bacterium]|nr:hypothetical protein [Gemmataceae bacterium]